MWEKGIKLQAIVDLLNEADTTKQTVFRQLTEQTEKTAKTAKTVAVNSLLL